MGIIAELNIQGPPDLCIEDLSPGTESIDRERKMAVYARYGALAYWIIDPVREGVSVFEIDGDAYAVRVEATEDDAVTSGALPGFAIAARDVFAWRRLFQEGFCAPCVRIG